MGVAKSLRKAGHLEQLGQGLSDLGAILENNRKKKEKQDFINNVIGLYDNWKSGQEKAEQKGTVMQEGKTVNNVFSPENLSPNQKRNIMGVDKKPGMNLDINIPENIQEDVNKMPPVIPETKTRQTTPEEQYSKAQSNLGEFEKNLAPIVMNPNLDENSLSRVNVLSNIARNQTEKLKPKEPEYFDLSQGEKRFKRNQTTGKIEEVAYNPKIETDKNSNKKDFKVSEDGYFMYWDDNENAGKGGFVKTNEKAPKDKGEQSAAWARLFYEMTKDKEEGANKKKESQGKYNSIMGSPFLSIDELKAQGITIPEGAEKKGGAYLVRDDKDYKNYKVFYTDEELQNYAENQVSDTPNKWNRKDPAGIKDEKNDPLGIR